eukprot:6204561-Pleurochrysis_carterae.AAC.3
MADIKLNTECAFPNTLDLEPYTKQGLAARAAKQLRQSPQIYELVGVVVHSGTANYGHYFSYIQSRDQPHRWHMFNDAQASDERANLIRASVVRTIRRHGHQPARPAL